MNVLHNKIMKEQFTQQVEYKSNLKNTGIHYRETIEEEE